MSRYELSANVEWLFTEAGPHAAERIRAAAAHGLRAVELWNWRDKDLAAVDLALTETGTVLQTVCVEPMGSLVDPTGHDHFLSGLTDSITVAERLGAPFLVVTAGDLRPGISRSAQQGAIISALHRAATRLDGHGVTLLLENLNSRVDHVGTFLDSTSEALDCLREVDSAQIRLLYDLYHSLVMDEDPVGVLSGAMDWVGHVQIADVPGRGEPGSGVVDWSARLTALRALGYAGRLGLEYQPRQPTESSLIEIESIAARS